MEIVGWLGREKQPQVKGPYVAPLTFPPLEQAVGFAVLMNFNCFSIPNPPHHHQLYLQIGK